MMPDRNVVNSIVSDEVEIRPHGDAQFISAIVVCIGDGYPVSAIACVPNSLSPHRAVGIVACL